MKKKIDGEMSYSAQQIILLLEFLKEKYMFRRNIMTGTVEYINKEIGGSWQPLQKYDQNTITLRALQSGVEAWDKDVRRFIESSLVKNYNPLQEYLMALPKWDRHDRIGRLARRVPTTNPYWEKDFHLWFRAMVAQWLQVNPDHGNTLTPLLIGAQGDGKSTFCRLILPPELRMYYTDRIDFANRNEAVKSLMRFALINIDEYDSISSHQSSFLKHILQKADVKIRCAYSSVMERHLRYASFIATTNDTQPLTDPTGSRRFLCIETCGPINLKRFINYPQIYAQAVAEINEGYPTWFRKYQEQRIQRENMRFQRIDYLCNIFMECFRMAEDKERPIAMTLLDILKVMKSKNSSIRIDNGTLIRLGKILSQQGFKAFRTEKTRGYYVVPTKVQHDG